MPSAPSRKTQGTAAVTIEARPLTLVLGIVSVGGMPKVCLCSGRPWKPCSRSAFLRAEREEEADSSAASTRLVGGVSETSGKESGE